MDSEEIRKQMKYVERIHRPNYIYVDHRGRLKTTGHQLNAGSETLLADNEYDELGRLRRNKRNSQAALVTDYTYNLRSWMKSVTGALFNHTLYYQDSYAENTPSYSGNISAMNWTAHGDKKRGYTFDYDNLSRLKKADYLEADLANTNYSTGYVYDKHGNITSLTRRGRTGVSAFGVVDALTLNYNGNQLVKVTDAAVNPTLSGSADFKDGAGLAAEYTYDQNGSMKTDLNKGISQISYNSLNLPSKLVIANSLGSATNTYLYAADGKKLNVTMQCGSSNSKSTDYVGSKIYENGSLKRILVDGGYIENGIYHYYLQDHLGNNRVVAKTDGTVVQTNHYYPFGMAFAEGVQGSNQPFKYNGKELDAERGLNLYDYMARLMDATLGRFTTVDPMAEKYYNMSPYIYCANNPLKYVDPDGRDWRVQTNFNEETKKMEYQITVNAVLFNNSSNQGIDMQQLSANITKQIESVYNISGDDFTVNMDFNLKVVDSVDEIGERDHVMQIVDQTQLRSVESGKLVAADSSMPGLSIRIGDITANNLLNGTDTRTVGHELGHTGGLQHLTEKYDSNNLMMQGFAVKSFNKDYHKSTQLYHSQIKAIRNNYINNKLNIYTPLRSNLIGIKSLGR